MQMDRLANVPSSAEALPSRQRDVPATLALDIVTRLLLAPGSLFQATPRPGTLVRITFAIAQRPR